MREIGFSEIKGVALDILKDVAQFCDTHDIRYVLAYGTMLGAVRHKGFIPWDDDIFNSITARNTTCHRYGTVSALVVATVLHF